MGHLGPEELRRVQRGLVDHHGYTLGLHALHDALDGARAEDVAVGLHRETKYSRNRRRLAFALMSPYSLRRRDDNEVLTGAIQSVTTATIIV